MADFPVDPHLSDGLRLSLNALTAQNPEHIKNTESPNPETSVAQAFETQKFRLWVLQVQNLPKYARAA